MTMKEVEERYVIENHESVVLSYLILYYLVFGALLSKVWEIFYYFYKEAQFSSGVKHGSRGSAHVALSPRWR